MLQILDVPRRGACGRRLRAVVSRRVLLSFASAVATCSASSGFAQQLHFSDVVAPFANESVVVSPALVPAGSGYFVTWTELIGALDLDVKGGFLDADGHFVGSHFVINTDTTDTNADPSVATLSNGGFVVVWNTEEQDGDHLGVFGQRLDATGAKVGTEFQVNSYTTGAQFATSVAGLADGGFVVTWTNSPIVQIFSGPYWPSFDIAARRYDASGVPTGTEFFVNSYITDAQHLASAFAMDDGGFVVVWNSDGEDGDAEGVYGRRYDAGATAAGSPFAVNVHTTGDQRDARLVELPDGDLLVTWYSGDPFGFAGQDGNSLGVYGRVLDADGAPVGGEFQVNDFTTGGQFDAQPQLLADGKVLIMWQSEAVISDQEAQDGSAGGIFARRFDDTGSALEDEFRVNAYWRGDQRVPRPLADAAGGFVTLWEGSVPNGSGGYALGYRLTRACVDSTGDADGDGIGDACDACNNPGTQTVSISPRFKMKSVGSDLAPDNDGMGFSGEAELPAGLTFASLDPSTMPIRLRAVADSGIVMFDETLAVGVFAGNGSAGWSINGSGTTWTFRDKTVSPANGIVSAAIQDRSASGPARVRFKLKGRNGVYPLNPIDERLVNLTIVLGDGSAGECVETAFEATDCRFGGLDTRFSCRR